jgi:hypothetical protein
MTLCPSERNIAATVEESTPPDMATAMFFVGIAVICELLALSF